MMDDWVRSDDIWVARTAILHQLTYRDDTDGDRLFVYCRLRAGDSEFFIRKAIGWALRTYAAHEPDRVAVGAGHPSAVTAVAPEATKGVERATTGRHLLSPTRAGDIRLRGDEPRPDPAVEHRAEMGKQ